MDQVKKDLSPEQMSYIWIAVGIGLAIAFIVIGSVFFGLKPGPEPTTNAPVSSTAPETGEPVSPAPETEEINPSLYAPSEY
ncbi:MAG: hypothetical protein AAB855_05270 [Patescibacteria group bacterium]